MPRLNFGLWFSVFPSAVGACIVYFLVPVLLKRLRWMQLVTLTHSPVACNVYVLVKHSLVQCACSPEEPKLQLPQYDCHWPTPQKRQRGGIKGDGS